MYLGAGGRRRANGPFVVLLSQDGASFRRGPDPATRHGRASLMARLREGRAHTARGAAHFLRETVGRVRHAGAR